MNDAQLAKLPTLDVYASDLDEFERTLNNLRLGIDYYENVRDPFILVEARKQIAGALNTIEQARHFIWVKQQGITETTSDVAEIFDVDLRATQPGELQANPHSQDEDTQ